VSETKKVIWTNTAKDQLRIIFNYYNQKSPQGAKNLKDDILRVTKNLHFSEQYQKDEIESQYRRIFVRDYKILYKEENNFIFIIRIFSTKRDPFTQL
jgi:plasmid stabilization system protein ParE